MKITVLILAAVMLAGCAGDNNEDQAPRKLAEYPIRDLQGVISRSGIELDRDISSDGNGSIRIEVTEPGKFFLYETGDLDVENARLSYGASIRTRDIKGKVYLEMLCGFPGKGEFFSRGMANPLTGTNEWSSQEISFLLREGENPDNIKLNIVAEGTGTVWVDEIRLTASAIDGR
ncbi:MAG: hypothetical protein GF417_04700 [Candidatus Latescibacteria bacterium]|nr:hypothetical protein [bacterium]MBD3423720.1 hypothetical protein [Candidatus Latescibacterota bacterium]